MAFVGMSKLAAQSLGTAKAETKHARKDESGNTFKQWRDSVCSLEAALCQETSLMGLIWFAKFLR